ncbi:hypothetical protein IMCC3317_43030 [Kordia antarctica]|uniref:Uncharacterized protein n=1 Tax=Kordia antarctica TaxID=1218801 RepID=A0A7L4ZQ85_9FLAO|nr:hypothetical protein [Kordia antarctica]QHI38903.1 hypothetical protein IMCC3317_43030 [Kordia antarctica]
MSGFASLANSIIRNNRRKRLDKLERVERYIGTESSVAEYNETSEYMLHKIRNRMQEEQKQSRRKTIIIFSVVGVILISVMSYFLFIHEFPNEVPLIFQF